MFQTRETAEASCVFRGPKAGTGTRDTWSMEGPASSIAASLEGDAASYSSPDVLPSQTASVDTWRPGQDLSDALVSG